MELIARRDWPKELAARPAHSRWSRTSSSKASRPSAILRWSGSSASFYISNQIESGFRGEGRKKWERVGFRCFEFESSEWRAPTLKSTAQIILFFLLIVVRLQLRHKLKLKVIIELVIIKNLLIALVELTSAYAYMGYNIRRTWVF